MSKVKNKRSLHVTTAGKWYLLLTIGFGVVAISSRNNVLYLLESLLLGSVIVSGILSELAVLTLQVSWRQRQSLAGETSRDELKITNTHRFPIFCIEIGHYNGRDKQQLLFIPYIGGRRILTLPADSLYESRGEKTWQGIYIATSYPFGFALKTNHISDAGKRVVWPPNLLRKSSGHRQTLAHRRSSEVNPGEIRVFNPGEDYRDVVWTKSMMRNELIVRPKVSRNEAPVQTLNLKKLHGEALEQRISEIASEFYHWMGAAEAEAHAKLQVIGPDKNKQIYGIKKILYFLSVVENNADPAKRRHDDKVEKRLQATMRESA